MTSNTAISIDGRINTRERRFTSLGSARDHARMSALRADADAVLVGGATFRMWPHASLPDDPVPPRPQRLWNVLVSRTLDLPLAAAFAEEPRVRPLVLTRGSSVPAGFALDVEAWHGDDEMPVSWMLDVLRRRGIDRLLVEAGGDLMFQFLAADAIDEMHVTLCPLVIGGDAPSLADGAGFGFDAMKRMRLRAADVDGDEVFLHYEALRGGDARR